MSAPRTPCRTFSAFLHLKGWIKTFTEAAKPGAYLRVMSPGTVQAGDAISIDDRPDHDVTISLVFRARMSDPGLLPQLLAADALSSELRAYASRRDRAKSFGRRRFGPAARRAPQPDTNTHDRAAKPDDLL